MTIASILSDLWMGGGGLLKPPQAQELQKRPGGIGLMFLYIGLMDWGTGHLIVIVGTGGGAFANENCLRGRAFYHFFQTPGVCPARGTDARGWN